MANNAIFNLNIRTNSDLAGVNQVKRSLNEVKQMADNIDFAMDSSDIQEMIRSAEALERAMEDAFDPDLNTVNVQKFNRILAESGLNIDDIQSGLAKAGAVGQQAFLTATGQLMKMNDALKYTNKFLDDIAVSFANTVRWSALSSIVNSITGSIQSSYYYVKDLDGALNDIRIVTGQSADSMADFADEANEAAKALAVSTKDYTEGALIYYQQGLDDETVKTLTDITAKTSNVTGQGMDTVSEQLTAVWNGYQVANRAAEEGMQVYEEYVDKMAAVGAATAADLEELSVAMSKVASAANTMGVDFDELNAQIATIVSVTRQAPESVGTALKTIYARMGDLQVDGVDEYGVALGTVSSTLDDLGIRVLDVNGDLRDMGDVVNEVGERWDSWTNSQQTAIAVALAGKRQYNNLLSLFSNWGMYTDTLNTSLEAAGTLTNQQAIALDSLDNKMDRLRATAEDLYGNLYDEDTIKDMVDGLTQVLQFTADFTEAAGGLEVMLPLLGSIGVQVFSNQIGGAIGGAYLNIENFFKKINTEKANFEALKAMYADSSVFTATDTEGVESITMQTEVENIKNYYNEMYKYSSIMTSEEKQQYNLILDKKVALASLKVELEQQKAALAENKIYISYMGEETLDTEKNFSKLVARANELSVVLSQLNNSSFDGDATYEQVKDEIEAIFGKNSKDFESINAQLIEMEKRGRPAADAFKTIRNQIAGVVNGAVSFKDVSTQITNIGNSADKAGEQLRRSLNIKQNISDITSALGMMGQTITAIPQIASNFRILGDVSADTQEKIAALSSSLAYTGSFLPSILQTFSGEGFQNLLKSFDLEKQIKQLSRSRDLYEQEYNAFINSLNPDEERNENENAVINSLRTQAEEAGEQIGNLREQLDELRQVNGEKLFSSLIKGFSSVITIIATAIALYQQYQEAQRQAMIDNLQDSIDTNQKIIDEIEANEKLYDSYSDLYEQYQNNEIEKEELYDVTEELCKSYDIEGSAIANLTGDYEELTAAIKAAKKADSEEKKRALEENIGFETQKALYGKGLQRWENEDGAISGITRDVNAGFFTSEEESAELDYVMNQLKDFVDSKSYKVDNGTLSITVGSSSDEIIAAYEAITETLKTGVAEGDLDFGGDVYNSLKSYAESLFPTIDEFNAYKARFDQLDKVITDIAALDSNIDFAKSQSEFEVSLKAFEESLSQQGKTDDEIQDLVDSYLRTLNNVYAQKFLASEEYKQLASEEVANFLSNSDLTTDEVNKLFMILDIDENTSLETVKEAIENVKEILPQDTKELELTTVLRQNISEGEELDKEALKSLRSENDGVYKDLLEDFETKSGYEQLEILNEIAIAQAKVNLESAVAMSQKKENLELLEEEYKAEKARLELAMAGALKDAQDAPVNSSEYEEAMALVNELQQQLDTLESNHYSVNIDIELDDAELQYFESAVDSITSLQDNLTTAAELIGQSFKVAADDVGTLLNMFPQLAENAQVLADGSLKLNQQVVQEVLKGKSDILGADSDTVAGQIENQIKLLDMQISAKESQLEIIQAVLDGEITASEAVKKLEEVESKFKEDCELAFGKVNAEVSQDVVNNSYETTKTALQNLDAIGERINAVADAYSRMLAGEAAGYVSQGFAGATQAANIQMTASSYVDKINTSDGGDAEEIAKYFAELQAITQKEYDTLVSQRADYVTLLSQLNSSTKDVETAVKGAASGIGGKQDSKSGGSRTQKETKKYRDEFDRYYEFTEAIEQATEALNDLEREQEHLFGNQLIQSLKHENKLLTEQAKVYEQLAAAQREEAQQLQATLGGHGLAFDASGAIANYAEATTNALAQYNDAIAQYNAGLLSESAFEAYEKNYQNFKDDLSRYDALYDEMVETQNNLEDISYQIVENNLLAWETEIQIKLDMSEAEREWSDFIKEINSDFKAVYRDLGKDFANIQEKFDSYLSQDGDVNVNIGAINDVVSEIDKMQAGGKSDMFISISEAQEKLKELRDGLMENATDLHDMWEEAWDAYLEGIDQAADQLEDLMDKFDRLSDELEYQGELIELLYGTNSYELMDKLYEAQELNNVTQIDSLRQQAEMWKKMYDSAEEGTEEQQKYYELWTEAQSDLNDLVIEHIKLLKEDYLNTVDSVVDQLEKSLTGGLSFDDMEAEWERAKESSERYYDSIERIYQLEQLEGKWQDAINGTTDLKNQQAIAKLKDAQLDDLKNQVNLSEYDIQLSEKKLAIAQAQIALEEAQKNKSSMQLKRDAQGNWVYQYTADEEQINQSEEDLLQTYQELYEFVKKAQQEALDEIVNRSAEYSQMIKDIAADETLTQEEKMAKYQELYDLYYNTDSGILTLAYTDFQKYQEDMNQVGAETLWGLYELDAENYGLMTEQEKALIDDLRQREIDGFFEMEEFVNTGYDEIRAKCEEVSTANLDTWNTAAKNMADAWNADDGVSVKSQVFGALSTLYNATHEFEIKVIEASQAAGQNFYDVAGAVNTVTEQVYGLSSMTAEMCQSAVDNLSAYQQMIAAIEAQWYQCQSAIMGALQLAQQYIALQASWNPSSDFTAGNYNAGGDVPTGSYGSNQNGNQGNIGNQSGYGDQITRTVYFYSYDDKDGYKEQFTGSSKQDISDQIKKYMQNNPDVYKYYTKLDSGGYTGDWNSSEGRVALLHEKELVLNKQDTANILETVSAVRDLAGIQSSITNAVWSAIANAMTGFSAAKVDFNKDNSTHNEGDTIFQINAEFPDVYSASEIKEALMSLPNLASQYISRNRL